MAVGQELRGVEAELVVKWVACWMHWSADGLAPLDKLAVVCHADAATGRGDVDR